MTEHRFYTSTYALWNRVRPEEITPVQITRTMPRTIPARDQVRMESSPLLMGRGVTFPPVSRTHFEQAYRASLTRAGVARIGRELSAIHRRHDRPLLLLDWGSDSDHRLIFSAWWLEQTGEHVPEYSFSLVAPPHDDVALAARPTDPGRQLALI